MQRKEKLALRAAIVYAIFSVVLVFFLYSSHSPFSAAYHEATKEPDVFIEELVFSEDSEATQIINGEKDTGNQDEFEILEQDVTALNEQYALPSLERMAREERQELVEQSGTLRRMISLGINVSELRTPEMNWKGLYSHARREVLLKLTERGNALVFNGEAVSQLNAFLKSSADVDCVVSVESVALALDEPLTIPDNVYLQGNGVELTAGKKQLEHAVELKNANACGVSGLVIDGGCDNGIYVENCDSFILLDNSIFNVNGRGIALSGRGSGFWIADNHILENGAGGILVEGDYAYGVLANNTVTKNHGSRNYNSGIVLCSAGAVKRELSKRSKPVDIEDIVEAPHNLVLYCNTVSENRAGGIFSSAGYMNYMVFNEINGNEREGVKLECGSFGNYLGKNSVIENGNFAGMSDEELMAESVAELGRQADGSSPAKQAGISLDNAAYNTLFQNIIAGNYGSGIKAIRAAHRNIILCNEIAGNNVGLNEYFHYFGIEFGAAPEPDKSERYQLDYTPCYENISARNLILGEHYSGIYLSEGSYCNDSIDNTIMGCTNWSMECFSERFNSSVNNHSVIGSLGIELTPMVPAIRVAGRAD